MSCSLEERNHFFCRTKKERNKAIDEGCLENKNSCTFRHLVVSKFVVCDQLESSAQAAVELGYIRITVMVQAEY